MSKENDIELLAKKKFDAIFELIQKKAAEKRKKTTDLIIHETIPVQPKNSEKEECWNQECM